MEQKVRTVTPQKAAKMREEASRDIKIAEAMVRLESNEDFKLVFTQGYEQDEPRRITSILTKPQFCCDTVEKKTLHREICNEQLIGIANFVDYINTIYFKADMAQKELNSLDDAEKRFREEFETGE